MDFVTLQTTFISSPPEVLLRKSFLKICSKSTGEYPCRSTISVRLHASSQMFDRVLNTALIWKQSSKGLLKKGYSEIMLQIYRRTPTPKCDFKILKSHFGMFVHVNLLHIFRIPFLKNNSGRLFISNRQLSVKKGTSYM